VPLEARRFMSHISLSRRQDVKKRHCCVEVTLGYIYEKLFQKKALVGNVEKFYPDFGAFSAVAGFLT